MMSFFQGIILNFRGLWLGLRNPRLLFLGIIRFVAVLIVTILAASLILIYHREILNLLWKRPDSHLILWLWYLLSWFLSLLLVGLSTVLAYLLSQVLFAVVLMDRMSRITERLLTGRVEEPKEVPFSRLFLLLAKQEFPRSIIPVLISMVIMIAGWVTPLGPIIMVLSTGSAVIFLAWDNTDLVPARRLMSFGVRFRFLLRNLLFHLGFGLPFLIPGLNILLLSFAPVGGTLFQVEREGSVIS
ncbi:MAG: EI24 domain-containing protein [Desulfatiglandaceae bacterium]|jgi:CysZ protein